NSGLTILRAVNNTHAADAECFQHFYVSGQTQLGNFRQPERRRMFFRFYVWFVLSHKPMVIWGQAVCHRMRTLLVQTVPLVRTLPQALQARPRTLMPDRLPPSCSE